MPVAAAAAAAAGCCCACACLSAAAVVETLGSNRDQVTFLFVLGSMAFVSILTLLTGNEESTVRVTHWNARRVSALVVLSSIGGMLSALSATGANLLIYTLTVVAFDLSPSTAVPTTVITTAALSMVGMLVLATAGQQFDVHYNSTSSEIYAVGSTPVEPPCAASECDLVGLVYAAAPIVVWGAPLGAEFIRHIGDRNVVAFVAAVCVASVVGFFVVLEELHSATLLLAYALSGLLLGPICVVLLRRHRTLLFGHWEEPLFVFSMTRTTDRQTEEADTGVLKG
ncbi:hypothetical protein OAO87_03265 [bacterium]|nr:hypothetical protein [bacterium]